MISLSNDTTTKSQTIFIVDDNVMLCNELRCVFESVHFNVETYHSAEDFLMRYVPHRRNCLIVDVRMPNMSGLELLEQLSQQKKYLCVIVITEFKDPSTIIRAMKLGAVDVLFKPLDQQYLLELVQRNVKNFRHSEQINSIKQRVELLSARERQVIDLILEGKLSKEIAYELSVSMSTVEVHRANIMRKMKAKNIAHLIKIYLQSQFELEFTR